MTQRVFLSAVGVAICMLLLVLAMEAAGMRRSLRRIESEQRELVNAKFRFLADSSADSLWRNATDGAWILVPFSGSGTCPNCGPFYHRFFTQKGCEGALAEWNVALNGQRRATGFILEYRIGVLGKCEAHPLRH
jgi:hypothetical protein